MLSTYDKDLLNLIMWECSYLKERRFVKAGLHDRTCQEPTELSETTSTIPFSTTTSTIPETTTVIALKTTNGHI